MPDLEKFVVTFRIINNCSYEPILLPMIAKISDDNIGKKELVQILTGNFRELIFRDKFECIEYSKKFEINFNFDLFFGSLLKIREGGETDSLEGLIKGFIPNSRELVTSIVTVLTGKKAR